MAWSFRELTQWEMWLNFFGSTIFWIFFRAYRLFCPLSLPPFILFHKCIFCIVRLLQHQEHYDYFDMKLEPHWYLRASIIWILQLSSLRTTVRCMRDTSPWTTRSIAGRWPSKRCSLSIYTILVHCDLLIHHILTCTWKWSMLSSLNIWSLRRSGEWGDHITLQAAADKVCALYSATILLMLHCHRMLELEQPDQLHCSHMNQMSTAWTSSTWFQLLGQCILPILKIMNHLYWRVVDQARPSFCVLWI